MDEKPLDLLEEVKYTLYQDLERKIMASRGFTLLMFGAFLEYAFQPEYWSAIGVMTIIITFYATLLLLANWRGL